MIAVATIRVEQAEGRTGRLVDGTVSTFDEAFSLLHRIAWDGPDLGYYKTDVLVTWADGVSLKLRHDVKRWDSECNDTCVSSHLKRWAIYVQKYAARLGDESLQRLAREIQDNVRASS